MPSISYNKSKTRALSVSGKKFKDFKPRPEPIKENEPPSLPTVEEVKSKQTNDNQPDLAELEYQIEKLRRKVENEAKRRKIEEDLKKK